MRIWRNLCYVSQGLYHRIGVLGLLSMECRLIPIRRNGLCKSQIRKRVLVNFSDVLLRNDTTIMISSRNGATGMYISHLLFSHEAC